MGSVWIVLFVCGLCVVAWIVGKGERKAPPAPPPEYPARRRGWWPRLRMKAEDAGLLGERLLVDQLRFALDPARYIVLEDVYLPVRRGGTAQIDCVVVCPGGVVAVEVKNWQCIVHGKAEDRRWLCKYRRSWKLKQNPRVQNQGHVDALRENFGRAIDAHLRAIVAFCDEAHFAKPMPRDVMHFADVPAYLQRISAERGDPLSVEKVAAIAEAIRRVSDSVTQEERDAHVENLRRRGKRMSKLHKQRIHTQAPKFDTAKACP